jgi:(2Fe-2S) ferredoxin
MQPPSYWFNLDGICRGFLGEEKRKPKSLLLEVDGECLAIKLPKELRPNIQQWLQVGDRVRCVGRSHIDHKAGVIKLKAYQVFSLAPGAEATASTTVSDLTSPEVVGSPATPSPKRKQGKIIVCQKSGCQKRGGRQMIAALEQVLQQHQLQDQVEIRYTGCQKRCSKAPTLTIMPGKHCYDRLNPNHLSALIEEHFCPPDALSAP